MLRANGLNYKYVKAIQGAMEKILHGPKNQTRACKYGINLALILN
jgi:hypothetical protein